MFVGFMSRSEAGGSLCRILFNLGMILATSLLLYPSQGVVVASFSPQQPSSRPLSFPKLTLKSPLLTIRRGGFQEEPASSSEDDTAEAPSPPTEPAAESSFVDPAESAASSPIVPPPVTGSVAVAATTAPRTPSRTPNLGPNAPDPGPLRKMLPRFPWYQLPNYLTYIRCLAIPALAWMFYVPNLHVGTSVVFAVASFTDWLDGYLARRWDITSPFGAFLDPVADKLMVSTCLILLSGRYGLQVAIPTAIILAREIAVSALREWMAQRGQRDSVKVGMQGKVKTALTMLTITILLLVPDATTVTGATSSLKALFQPAMLMLYASTLVTVTSGSVYFKAAAPLLFSDK